MQYFKHCNSLQQLNETFRELYQNYRNNLPEMKKINRAYSIQKAYLTNPLPAAKTVKIKPANDDISFIKSYGLDVAIYKMLQNFTKKEYQLYYQIAEKHVIFYGYKGSYQMATYKVPHDLNNPHICPQKANRFVSILTQNIAPLTVSHKKAA